MGQFHFMPEPTGVIVILNLAVYLLGPSASFHKLYILDDSVSAGGSGARSTNRSRYQLVRKTKNKYSWQACGKLISDRKELCYSPLRTPPKKEADRLVVTHKAGPKPSTFNRKADDYDYS